MPHMLAATALFDPAHRGQSTRQSSQTRLRQGFAGQSCRNPSTPRLRRAGLLDRETFGTPIRPKGNPQPACGRQIRNPPRDFARDCTISSTAQLFSCGRGLEGLDTVAGTE